MRREVAAELPGRPVAEHEAWSQQGPRSDDRSDDSASFGPLGLNRSQAGLAVPYELNKANGRAASPLPAGPRGAGQPVQPAATMGLATCALSGRPNPLWVRPPQGNARRAGLPLFMIDPDRKRLSPWLRVASVPLNSLVWDLGFLSVFPRLKRERGSCRRG